MENLSIEIKNDGLKHRMDMVERYISELEDRQDEITQNCGQRQKHG